MNIRQHNRWIGRYLLLALLLTLYPPCRTRGEASGPTPVETLENLVREEIELRIRTAAEKREAERQTRFLNSEISLLTREEDRLKKEIDSLRRISDSSHGQRATLIAQRQSMESALTGLIPLLRRTEEDLEHWKAHIPPSLRGTVDPAFRQLPDGPETAQGRPVLRRLQTVLHIYSAIEELQSHFNVVKELIRGPDGTEIEMDVLYIGLAAGLAVSGDNTFAAIGSPGASGWIWRSDSKAAKSIRAAISTAAGDKAAALIDIPIHIVPNSEATGQ